MPTSEFRKVRYRNLNGIFEANPPSGIFSCNLCIERQGNVTHSEVDTIPTTYVNHELIQKLLKAASGYKYAEDLSAPKTQCGNLVIKTEIRSH